MNLSNKLLTFYFSLILISVSFFGSISGVITTNNSSLLNDSVLDQKQVLHNREFNIKKDILLAQEFKPSKTPLTKVFLKIRKTYVIEEPLIVSIREELDDFDITFIPILGNDIPFSTFWVEFDFDDIEVDIDETYYIIVRSTSTQSFWWQTQYNLSDQGDPYNRGKLWLSINDGRDWESLDGDSFFDLAFKTYTYNSKPDLYCEGYLDWNNVTPKSQVSGSFTIENIGTPLSYLDWKIYNWPIWGAWTFSKKNGTNLKPEDGPLTIQVTVKAPNITNSQYSGFIKIINLNDDEDFCIIDSSLATPKAKSLFKLHILESFKTSFKLIKYLKLPFLFD